MTDTLACWKCGAPLEQLPLPLARLAECLACGAELHVCRLCEFYDPGVAKQCREPIAEEVKEKQRANFCDYFQPRPDAHVAKDDSEARRAQRELASLFGDTDADNGASSPAADDDSRRKLDDLFRKG